MSERVNDLREHVSLLRASRFLFVFAPTTPAEPPMRQGASLIAPCLIRERPCACLPGWGTAGLSIIRMTVACQRRSNGDENALAKVVGQ